MARTFLYVPGLDVATRYHLGDFDGAAYDILSAIHTSRVSDPRRTLAWHGSLMATYRKTNDLGSMIGALHLFYEIHMSLNELDRALNTLIHLSTLYSQVGNFHESSNMLLSVAVLDGSTFSYHRWRDSLLRSFSATDTSNNNNYDCRMCGACQTMSKQHVMCSCGRM